MGKLLSIDGPLMQKATKLADLIIASVLWLVFSLPVFTIGASSAALYETVYKNIRNDRGHLWQTFWGAFRENFKRSTIVWLIALAVQAFIVFDALVLRSMEIKGEPLGKVYWVMLVIFCISVTWVTYLTAYASRFNGKARDVLRCGFVLMALHPIRSLSVFASVLCGILLAAVVPGMLIILPSLTCLICSIPIEKVFLQHMRPDDIEKMNADELK